MGDATLIDMEKGSMIVQCSRHGEIARGTPVLRNAVAIRNNHIIEFHPRRWHQIQGRSDAQSSH